MICGAPSSLLFRTSSGIAVIKCISRLRSGISCLPSSSRCSPLIRTALAEAAIPATFSVPARFPFSWEPPVSSGNNAVPSRTTSIPVPRGPRILCGDRLYSSACHSFSRVSSLP
ncbi:hypothetical protein D3C75_1011190 [compost metagenome]